MAHVPAAANRPAPRSGAAAAELLAYLILGAAARKKGGSLLRPKIHFFIRGLDEMFAALAGTADTTILDVALSLNDAKERHADRRDDAFFPVLVCHSCGRPHCSATSSATRSARPPPPRSGAPTQRPP